MERAGDGVFHEMGGMGGGCQARDEDDGCSGGCGMEIEMVWACEEEGGE